MSTGLGFCGSDLMPVGVPKGFWGHAEGQCFPARLETMQRAFVSKLSAAHQLAQMIFFLFCWELVVGQKGECWVGKRFAGGVEMGVPEI